MGTPQAILAGTVVIAAAILFTFRWELAAGTATAPIFRLDRWTGEVVACNVQPEVQALGRAMSKAIKMECATP